MLRARLRTNLDLGREEDGLTADALVTIGCDVGVAPVAAEPAVGGVEKETRLLVVLADEQHDGGLRGCQAEDLRDLWRRMTFSGLISNFDDQLRNHGSLRTSTAGWSLSPAFDLNLDPPQ